MSSEYPNIETGMRWDQTSARTWRRLVEDVSILKKTVYGDTNVQTSASGQRINPEETQRFHRWPDKTVVIVRKPVEGDKTLLVREARYANLPPAPCTGTGDNEVCFYEWIGSAFEVYPPLGVKPIAYDGDEVANSITTPPKLSYTYYRIHREYDAWILSAPPSGGSSASYCLVHAPFNGGSTWGSSSANRFIRVVHFKPSGNTFVNAETNPLGYSIVTCWPRTNEAFWQPLQSTSGTGPFTATSTAVYCGTLTIGGVEYISPIHPIVLFTPNPAIAAGDC